MDSLVLSKCLPLALMPLAGSLLILGAAFFWRRWLLIPAALAILCVFGTPASSDFLMRSLEDRYSFRTAAECPHADAIFVFGGMLGPRDHLGTGPEWNDSAERFDRALAIYRAGKAPLLVFSGGPERYEGGPDEGEILKQEAVGRGIPDAGMFVTHRTFNTESEADVLCQLAVERRWKRVLIVTSAYHMPRAMRLTSRCSAERIPVPVAYETPDPRTSWAYKRPDYYLPQAQALFVSERAVREYLGILFYSVKR